HRRRSAKHHWARPAEFWGAQQSILLHLQHRAQRQSPGGRSNNLLCLFCAAEGRNILVDQEKACREGTYRAAVDTLAVQVAAHNLVAVDNPVEIHSLAGLDNPEGDNPAGESWAVAFARDTGPSLNPLLINLYQDIKCHSEQFPSMTDMV